MEECRLSDDELLAQWLQGDEIETDTFDLLYTRYARRFLAHVQGQDHRLASDDADDVVQAAFIKISQLRGSKRRVANAKGFLWRILTNCANDWHRSQGRRKDTIDIDGVSAELTNGPAEEQEESSRLFEDCVWRAFTRFARQNPESGEAIRLAIVDEWDRAALAEYLQRTYGATRQFLYKAKVNLRRFIERECPEELVG